MRIAEIVTESYELDEAMYLNEGMIDTVKKLIIGGSLAAASIGASAQFNDVYRFVNALEKDPKAAAQILGADGAAQLSKAAKDLRAAHANMEKSSKPAPQSTQSYTPNVDVKYSPADAIRFPTVRFGSIVGSGRAQFYDDMRGQNKMNGLFLVPGDKINAYEISKDRKFIGVQYTRKDGSTVDGWLPADRVNITGKGEWNE